jgi:enolase
MIKALIAKQILDSRKNPTVEVCLKTEKGVFFASCPSGASTGKNEAVVLDADRAVKIVNEVIGPKLIGLNETDQREIDELLNRLDGTKSKKNLGANAILPVSIAICRAGAKASNMPLFRYISRLFGGKASLPKPCFNVINGGAHTDNDLDIQEFMIIPQEKSFKKNLKIAKKVFRRLKRIIKIELGKQSTVLGDEGGFAPKIADPEQALRMLMASFGKFKIKIGLDCAATQFYKNKKYVLNKNRLNKEELLEYYLNISGKFPIAFIEDPFSETDLDGFKRITKKLGKSISIIGDDFLTTNIVRIRKAEESNACNGAIIKPNQIGTVAETLEAVRLAKSYGWKIVVSHRSGETMDDFIADLAVGVGADYIKSGAPSRPERLVKYKRLVTIERQLN